MCCHSIAQTWIAVRAADTYRAREEEPAQLVIRGGIPAGAVPSLTISEGTAAEIPTGAIDSPRALMRSECFCGAVVRLEYYRTTNKLPKTTKLVEKFID